MVWETVIGLEVHVQLDTKSKLFSGSSTTFGAEPNTQAGIYDLAMPGTLPVFNEEVLRMAVKEGGRLTAVEVSTALAITSAPRTFLKTYTGTSSR